MFEISMKSMVIKASPIALAVALAVGSTTAVAGKKGYLDAGKTSDHVTNSAGECWTTAGAAFKPNAACGDAMDKKAAPAAPDADGDGVPDATDQCPGTPAGVSVDKFGCEVDGDSDGVVDRNDRCPNTPPNTKVDSVGCTIIEDVTINLVEGEFDFDSAKLKPGMESELDGVAKQIADSAGNEQLDIVGHTDSTGPEGYNQGLSERRAQAVADYLSGKGVPSDSMSVSGMGETAPIADNGTREGRAQNRRVEIKTK
ncbi:MAG: OmpA family protein [bacterium]